MYRTGLGYTDFKKEAGDNIKKMLKPEIDEMKEWEQQPDVQEYIKQVKTLRSSWIYEDALALRDISKSKVEKKNVGFVKNMENEEQCNTRMNNYGLYLEDGDFEYWMPACVIDKDTPEYRRKCMRMLWILSRFTEWGEMDWAFVVGEYEVLLKLVEEDKTNWEDREL